MKRYKIEYWRGSIDYISELSNSERWNGVRISFFHDGRKNWQTKFKNDLLNGNLKEYKHTDSTNWLFINYKKDKQQGIQILFR